jgi:hypothetical protein
LSVSSAPSEVVEKLKTFLLANVAGLAKCYDGFPRPDQALVYPSCTILISNTAFTPMMPYVHRKGEIVENEDETIEALVQRCIGSYEFRLQLDIWCATKPLRHAMWEKFVQAFNKSAVPGIDLQLTNYFDIFAHYSLSNFEFLDTEPGSQRDEWRIRATVLADCRAIVENTEHLITTIENNLTTPALIEDDDEEDSVDLVI